MKRVREVNEMLGNDKLEPVGCELSNIQAFRRSIAAAIDLNAGAILSAEDLCFVRPGDQISPSRYDEVIGRKLSRNYKAFEPFNWQDLARAS